MKIEMSAGQKEIKNINGIQDRITELEEKVTEMLCL
jgi:hypothetical protein